MFNRSASSVNADAGREKLNIRAEGQTLSEEPKLAQTDFYGHVPMSLRGRFHNERARLGPDFTEADRLWRIRWLKDQELHPNEPYDIPEARKQFNIFRRIVRFPLNWFEDMLAQRVVRIIFCLFFIILEI